MKKLSNKILLIVLVALIAVFTLSRLFRSPGLESNLRKNLVEVDTATVTEVRILPSKDHAEEIKLIREGKNWKVSRGERQAEGDRNSVGNMLGSMRAMHAQRLVSRKKEKWDEFNVGDKSTHVSVYSNGDKIADFHVGKLGFNQGAGGSFGGAYTYVRLSDETEVYTVDGFMESNFNNDFNEWRNKTFLKLNKDDITKITYRYPADSGFVAEKRDSLWLIGGQTADAAKMESFTNQFTNKYLTDFADGFVPEGPADVRIMLDGKAGNLATVEAWRKDEKEWILTASTQKGVYFTNKSSNFLTDVLVGKKRLLP